jgi:predicted nucleic acid-binding protein
MPEVVFDCCVISNFALSESLAVLRSMFSGKSYITNFVSAEISRGIQSGHGKLAGIKEALKDGWLTEIALEAEAEKALLETLSVSLGFGEASSIAVARTKGYLLASDDKVARREATLLGVKLTGTIGILVNAVQKKIINTKMSLSLPMQALYDESEGLDKANLKANPPHPFIKVGNPTKSGPRTCVSTARTIEQR